MKVPFVRCAILGSALVAATKANAQQSAGWQFEATPYRWMAGMQGDVGVGPLTVEGAQASFGES